MKQCHKNWQVLLQHPGFMQKIRQAYSNGKDFKGGDVDIALYDGFVSDHDRNLFPRIRSTKPEKLADFADQFQDERYIELLFRYRAHNFPYSLSAQEKYRWQTHCHQQLNEEIYDGNLTLHEYHNKLSQLRTSCSQQAQLMILDELEAWGRALIEENI